MTKWVCAVCGYTVEAPEAPEKCPQCGATKFNKAGDGSFACVHEVGIGKDVDAVVLQGLKDHCNGECCEVGMYLAM